VFVEAEAGLGKTAFAAWLVKDRGYLSHFSWYSGHSVRTAMQNLSGQLIMRFGLDDQAPGGNVPEWAAEPSGFESLLASAAKVARARHDPLVVVVDGLDEAVSAGIPEGQLSFGLPRLLPDGVYVIATHRTGHWPGNPVSPARTLPIGQHDPRNTDDLELYLTRAIADDAIAARLASEGVDSAAFGAVLSDRSDGVWVYLRYVLEELRLSLRDPNTLDDLPSGLEEYYAAQIRRWRSDATWDSELLPLLATLGVAGEALSAGTLAKLSGGLNASSALRLCGLTFRPLLSATPVATTGTLQFAIYHSTFRETLRADHPSTRLGSGSGRSSESLVLADELRRATLAAHSRIADIYLNSFGGLETNLSALTADPSILETDEGYPLRHLARHLHEADRVEDLRRLLGSEVSSGNGESSNVWLTAREHAKSLSGYLDDVAWTGGGASAIRPLLESLPPRLKRMLLLRFFGSMTPSQIAHELGTPDQEVSQDLDRAIKDLLDNIASE
jgi:hypothetical protein